MDIDGTTPVIAEQPSDVTQDTRWRTPIRVVASDSHPLSYYWRFNGAPIRSNDLDFGPTLTSRTFQFYGAGLYDCVISNGCQAVVSRQAEVKVCFADIAVASGQQAGDGGVTIDDLLYFLDAYAQGNSNADIDDGSGTGRRDLRVSFEDLVFFLARYAEGC